MGQNCANPLFANYQITASGTVQAGNYVSGSVMINVQGATPQTFPAGASVCKSLAGMQSCCSASTLANITAAINATQTALKNSMATVVTAATALKGNSDAYANACSAGSAYTLSASSCVTFNANAKTVGTSATQLVTDANTCLSALQLYSSGMLCFACNADWNKYVSGSTVAIHTNTQTRLSAACGPLNADFTNMMNAVVGMLVSDYNT